MKIKFCGAAREVTGSSHLITLDDGFTILLDCGMYQGRSDQFENFNQEWLFDPSSINCMVLSHAHIDHTGKIPKLVKDGFRGTIYATHATRELSSIMLLDSAGIQERDAEFDNKKAAKRGAKPDAEPLYTVDNVRAAMHQFASFSYNMWFRIHPNVEVYFSDAGHILGSASVTLRVTEGDDEIMFGFTADIGRPNRPILRDPQPMPRVDFLVCESTYGDRLHDSAPEEINRLCQIVQKTCVEKRGKLIIPAFSVGRTQEIVYLLDKLATAGQLPKVPVYVDSPLAVDATEIFLKHPDCFDSELHDYMLHDPNPFGFKSLIYNRETEGSKKLNDMHDPCVIISASGMANAGRVKHHLYNNIGDWRTTVLIVGYASPETPAGQLRAGNKTVRIFGDVLPVNCDIEIMDSFSAHADYREILDFINNQKESVERLFLVHGDYDVQQTFQKYLNQNGFKHVEIPKLGEEFELKKQSLGVTKYQ